MIQNQMTFSAHSLCLFYMNGHELKHECGVLDHIPRQYRVIIKPINHNSQFTEPSFLA